MVLPAISEEQKERIRKEQIARMAAFHAGPLAVADFDCVITNDSVAFTNYSITAATANSYLWDFGDGNSSTQFEPTHTYDVGNDPESFTVTLTIFANGWPHTFAKAIHGVRNPDPEPPPPTGPTASFTWVNSSDLTVDFTDTSSQGTNVIDSWLWSFGDGATSTVQNPSRVYATSGVKNVSLTVKSTVDNIPDTATDTVTVQSIFQSPFDTPPTVAVGYTRYWLIASSEISLAEKNAWNSIASGKAMEFTSSSANRTVSSEHYTGAYRPNPALPFGDNGWFEVTFPGLTSGIYQRLLFSWQAGDYGAGNARDTVFQPYHFSNSPTGTASERVLRPGVRYHFGFDIRATGLDTADPPTRVTIWKAKHLIDAGDVTGGSDSNLVINLTKFGAGDWRFQFMYAGDSNVITTGALEYSGQLHYSGVTDATTYRVELEVLYGVNSTGELYAWVTPAGGERTQVINLNGITNYMLPGVGYDVLGQPAASRSWYVGVYVSDGGYGSSPMLVEFDNLYIDVAD